MSIKFFNQRKGHRSKKKAPFLSKKNKSGG